MNMNKAMENTTYNTALIEVTHDCQCDCPGCYLKKEGLLNDSNPSMTFDQAVNILDISREYLGRELSEVHLLGGEPLLWEVLERFIKHCRGRDIDVRLFTNMLGINIKLAGVLRDNDVTITGKLNVSPSGGAEQRKVQSKMLGSPDSYTDRLFAAIEVLKEAGYTAPKLRLNNFIRRDNLPYVPDYYRWCLVNDVTPDLELMSSGCGIDDEYFDLAPTPQELAQIIEKIQEIRIELGLPVIPVLMPHIFKACDHCRRQLYFALNGDIKACSAAGQKVLGNTAFPNAVKKARESLVIRSRINLTQETVGEPCHSCESWNECQGGCRATAESEGNPNDGYSLCPRPFMNS
jgi:radical SAM protein with 4Fe4S-binding SPASM domain